MILGPCCGSFTAVGCSGAAARADGGVPSGVKFVYTLPTVVQGQGRALAGQCGSRVMQQRAALGTLGKAGVTLAPGWCS